MLVDKKGLALQKRKWKEKRKKIKCLEVII